MLVQTNLQTNITSQITASQTTIPVSTGLTSAIAAGSYAYAVLDDGVNKERVKVTGGSTTELIVERALTGALSFVKGTCVYTDIGFATICELIAQGGCSATTACTPVSAGTAALPDAVVGVPYVGVVTFPNATSISLLGKPAWMTGTVNGVSIVLSGTPTATGRFALTAVAQGCSSSVSQLLKDIEVCQAVGVSA